MTELEEIHGHILVVDDNKINRMTLQRMLTNQGHRVTTVEDGEKALKRLKEPDSEPFDVVLLDILMPLLDGYQSLELIKGDPDLRHVPVIMISALDELDSVVRCIEIGATDYLTKPIQPALLRARLNSSLNEKRLRDLEREYLEQVGHVITAAEAVEASDYDPNTLKIVAAREDALGNLARVFQRMVREVHLREQRLRQQIEQIRLDMDEMKRALQEPLHIYIPMDRRFALVQNTSIPDRQSGCALFADISGFTQLTATFVHELGRQRGAEEITRLINQIYTALIEEVHFYGGSVIDFSGDAITCWFDGDSSGPRAAACGLGMQIAMSQFSKIITRLGSPPSLYIKVVVVSGEIRRFLIGDPDLQQIETMAGATLDRIAEAESFTASGAVIIDAALAERYPDLFRVSVWHQKAGNPNRYATLDQLEKPVEPAPWPGLAEDQLTDELCRPWLLNEVFQRVRSENKQYLSELRPTAALFLQFKGIEFDADPDAGTKLDRFVRWVQNILAQFEGNLLQFSSGDKGNYLYAAFGAPVAHADDAARAVAAALQLIALPKKLDYIHSVRIGLSFGLSRSGSYGGASRRTFGVIGTKVNLAARLMEAAENGILCDPEIYEATRTIYQYESLPPIVVKGYIEPVPIYRPTGEKLQVSVEGQPHANSELNLLSAKDQLTLKVASVIGLQFELLLLVEIHPGKPDYDRLRSALMSLIEAGILKLGRDGNTFEFADETLRQTAYEGMLFVQRRQLHRAIAEWFENHMDEENPGVFESLGRHWKSADDTEKAIKYLERAGQQALRQGDFQKAEGYFQECLELEANASVLSQTFQED